jgi:hypothetical protein
MRFYGDLGGNSRVCSALAGLETGVLGAMCLLLWQVAGSLLAGQPAWDVPTRLVTAVWGRGVSRDGLLAAASAGAALQLFGGGLVGVLFGLSQRSAWASRRVVLLGLVFGLGWYYLAYEVLLRRVGTGPYALLPRRSLMPAHLVFGLVLSAYPLLLRSLRRDLAGND